MGSVVIDDFASSEMPLMHKKPVICFLDDKKAIKMLLKIQRVGSYVAAGSGGIPCPLCCEVVARVLH